MGGPPRPDTKPRADGSSERTVEPFPDPPAPAEAVRDWCAVVHEELARLPEDYRAAVVFCDLEGLTRREAARRLGIPDGTLSNRLVRARAMLGRRLLRRGVGPGGLAGITVVATAPPELLAATTRLAASGRVPLRVRVLAAGGGLRTPLLRAGVLTFACVRRRVYPLAGDAPGGGSDIFGCGAGRPAARPEARGRVARPGDVAVPGREAPVRDGIRPPRSPLRPRSVSSTRPRSSKSAG